MMHGQNHIKFETLICSEQFRPTAVTPCQKIGEMPLNMNIMQ